MKYSALLLFISLFGKGLAQKENYVFMDADSVLYGFKNAKGEIIAEPRFILVGNESFKEVVSVIEQLSDNTYSSYYLRANGTRFGVDSVYFFDQSPEIESKGYVRFKDPLTKKAGVIHVSGKVVLPAEFDQIMEIRNGFVWGIRGATKECLDKNVPIKNCEHPVWVGGEKVLCRVNGELLSRNFFADLNAYVNLDYYTFEKSKNPSKDSFRKSFKAVGKGYFSFVNLDQTFDSWIRENWFQNPTLHQLELLIGDSLIVREEETGWRSLSRTDFLSSKSKEIRAFTEVLVANNYSYFNSYQDYSSFYGFSDSFAGYLTGADESNQWRYPCYEVVIDNKLSREQSHLEFLRTEKGWKLVSITLR